MTPFEVGDRVEDTGPTVTGRAPRGTVLSVRRAMPEDGPYAEPPALQDVLVRWDVSNREIETPAGRLRRLPVETYAPTTDPFEPEDTRTPPPIPGDVQVNDENPPEPGNVGLLDGAIGRRSALREDHPRQWWVNRLCNAITTGRTRESMYALLSRCVPCGEEWRYAYVLDADGKNATYPTPRQGQWESLRAQLRYLAECYNGGKYLVRCPTCGGVTAWEVESFDGLR